MRYISGDQTSLPYTDLCKWISLGTIKMVLYHDFHCWGKRNSSKLFVFQVVSKAGEGRVFSLSVLMLVWMLWKALTDVLSSEFLQQGGSGQVRQERNCNPPSFPLPITPNLQRLTFQWTPWSPSQFFWRNSGRNWEGQTLSGCWAEVCWTKVVPCVIWLI